MADFYKGKGFTQGEVTSFTPKETMELLAQGAFLVDLRDKDLVEFKAFGIDHVIHIPEEDFSESISTLSPENCHILADTAGIRARQYARYLIDNGFSHVALLSGGFIEWERDGLPVKTDPTHRLTGACACQLKPREKHKKQ